MSQLFTSGGQRIGASASATVLPMNIQSWFPLGSTGFTFLQSNGLSRVFSSTAIRKHQFFSVQSSLWAQLSHPHMTIGKIIALTMHTFVGKEMSLLFSTLSRFVMGLLRWHNGKESTCQCRRCSRCGFEHWVWKIPWGRKWQPTPVFLSGKLHGQRSLGSSAWSQTWLSNWACTHTEVCHSFPSKEQTSFNFMPPVSIHSDFGAQENKICRCFQFFPFYFPWSDGTRCHDVSFLNIEFQASFSLSSFTLIKRPFSSSSLSDIRVVASAYLRLLIISASNLDSSLWFIQPSISHDVLCIEVKWAGWQYSLVLLLSQFWTSQLFHVRF